MGRIRSTTRILALALALLTGLWAPRIRGESDPQGAAPDGPDTTGAQAIEPLCDLDTGFLAVSLEMPWGTDPFLKTPGFAHEKQEETLPVLDGVVYSRTEPMAIINGESVLVGDRIDGRTVQSIGRNYVVLKKGDSLRELVLPPVDPEEEDE